MKPPIYLTDLDEMRRVRLTQPRMSLEEARAQEAVLRLAAEKFSADARNAISSRGREKATV